LKLPEADDSRDLKAQKTAEKTIIKQNKENSNYDDCSYYYLSSDLGYVESTPIKSFVYLLSGLRLMPTVILNSLH
jgi:hypothetical protein